MELTRAKLYIDAPHAAQLVRGKAIAIKVPKGAEVLELRLAEPPRPDSFAKLCDVFFNGRQA